MAKNIKELHHITKLISLEQQMISKILNKPMLFMMNDHLFKIGLFWNDSFCRKVFDAFAEIIAECGTPDIVTISARMKTDDAFNRLIELSNANNY
jgi:hypothetical protein